MPYNNLVFKDPKHILVTYTLQFLLVTVLYPVPEQPGATPAKNYYRHFFGRLHRPQDFQFVVDGMTRVLNQPLQSNSSYLPGPQTTVRFAPELIMLFWEMTQCNKRFRSFIIDTERSHDFVVLTLFYALQYMGDTSKQGVVRMCAFLLQTLSVEKNFGVNLNKTFEGQETLPPLIRITGFKGTYADFLIQVSCWVGQGLEGCDTDLVTVNIHAHHQERGEAHSDISRPPCCHQQRSRVPGRPELGDVSEDYAPLQLHVVPVVPLGQ